MDKYSDALFENTHQKRATEANKQKVYGADMSGWANGEDHEEAVWDTADEPPAAQGEEGEEGTPEYDEDKFTHKVRRRCKLNTTLSRHDIDPAC